MPATMLGLDPYWTTGLKVNSAAPLADTGLSQSAGPGIIAEVAQASSWHPNSPMFWFGALVVTTATLMGLSTGKVRAGVGGRVGPIKGDLDIGKETK